MVKPVKNHRWDLSVSEAKEIQQDLAKLVKIRPLPDNIKKVAGVDVHFTPDKKFAVCVAVLLSFPGLEILEKVYASCSLRFPYVPGYLAFREGESILFALEKMKDLPDVLLFDAAGLAHPQRFGLACHIGILLDKPSIGCAKSLLYGKAEEPGEKKGDSSPIISPDGEKLGLALRTRDRTRCIYVSVGHLADLAGARRLTLACCSGYRIPEPLRHAHKIAKKISRNPGSFNF
ncbi:MAG: endonuclease V [Candidatus Eremiobacteraeota bacterium]|nr:endonuclease V [Candidatus Eremiobacteraeota bacterium]